MFKMHENYRRNIKKSLKDIPDDAYLYFHCSIGDWVCWVKKDKLIEKAYQEMPAWFFNSMCDVRVDGNTIYPVFTPIEQAAWDAAQKEYIRQKSEYCNKNGSE